MSASDETVSAVRAARLRLGLSQRQVAERMHVVLDTFQHWDRDENRPSDPATLQLLSRVLETPLDVLYPPEANPRVARALLDLEQAEIAAADCPPDTEAGPGEVEHPSEPGQAEAAVPVAARPELEKRPSRHPRHRRGARAAVLSAVSLVTGLVVAVVAVSGSDDRAGIGGGDAAAAEVVRQNREARIAMDAAAGRGDFDRAISIAGQIDDDRAASRYRSAAATILVQRASNAASRGDLPRARGWLRSARERYDTAPEAQAVTTRIRRIERDRSRRAAQERARARRRASASRTATPATPAPTAPAPAPASTPAPQPTTTTPSSGSTRTTPRERERTVDPGLF